MAALANLPLTRQEKQLFLVQLSTILSYFERLSTVDTQSVTSSTSFILPKPLREDEPRVSLPQNLAVSHAVATERGYIRIKGVFEE